VDGQFQTSTGISHWQDKVFLDEIIRNQIHVDLITHPRTGEVDKLHIKLVGEGFGDILLFTETRFDQRFANAPPASLGDSQCSLYLGFSNGPPATEDLP